MTLPENAPKYDGCSLQELRKFVTDRKIPFKYRYMPSRTKKTHLKKQKEEKLKLVTALRNNDATATFRLLDLPPELRDEVYYHFFMGHKSLMASGGRQCLQHIPEQIRDEMSAVFDAVRQRWEKREKKIEGAPSSGTLRIAVNLGTSRSWVYDPS